MRMILLSLLLVSCTTAELPKIHPYFLDGDGDGYSENTGDCDDTDPLITLCDEL